MSRDRLEEVEERGIMMIMIGTYSVLWIEVNYVSQVRKYKKSVSIACSMMVQVNYLARH